MISRVSGKAINKEEIRYKIRYDASYLSRELLFSFFVVANDDWPVEYFKP